MSRNRQDQQGLLVSPGHSTGYLATDEGTVELIPPNSPSSSSSSSPSSLTSCGWGQIIIYSIIALLVVAGVLAAIYYFIFYHPSPPISPSSSGGSWYNESSSAGFDFSTGSSDNESSSAGFDLSTGSSYNPSSSAGFAPSTGSSYNPSSSAGFDSSTGSAAPSCPVLPTNGTQPCDDFYTYVCQYWWANNPRPADTSRWGLLNKVQRNNDAIVEMLIKRSSTALVGQYWQSCMNTALIDSLGITPLLPWLSLIPPQSQLNTLSDYFAMAGQLKKFMGIDLLFQFAVWNTIYGYIPGVHQTTAALAFELYQYTQAGGQAAFLSMASSIFQNELGDSAADAATNALAVWQLESYLASNWDHGFTQAFAYSYTLPQFSAIAGVPLDAFFGPNGGNVPSALTRSPIVIQNALKLITAVPLIFGGNASTNANFTALYHHTRLHVYLFSAQYLGSTQIEYHHNLYNKFRLDVQELSAREIFCDRSVELLLGDAIARDFYDYTFSDAKLALVTDMVQNIHLSFQEFAPNFTWANAIAQAALQYKDQLMVNILGLPPVLRNYSQASISNVTFFNNTMNLFQVEWQQDFGQFDNPNPHSWAYSPVIVNAFYYPTRNSLNMPVGILQPGMFDLTMPYGGLYGQMGTVIGHELSHGFDSNGIRFNGTGVQTSWLPAATVTNYNALTTCFVTQYNSFSFKGTPLRGTQTLGENIADMGGIQLAYRAYKRYLALNNGTEPLPTMCPQPQTPAQLFFTSWALNWCTNLTDASALASISSGVHSLPFARVNGPLQNFPPFAAAFNCPANSFMNPPPAKQCSIYGPTDLTADLD